MADDVTMISLTLADGEPLRVATRQEFDGWVVVRFGVPVLISEGRIQEQTQRLSGPYTSEEAADAYIDGLQEGVIRQAVAEGMAG